MTITQLSRIDRTIEIQAPPERVWRALTSPAEISAWFNVTLEGEIAAGKSVWMTSTYPGCVGQRFEVRIVEFTPPVRMAWQWHPGQVDPAVDYAREPRTTVTFDLEPAGTGTRVRLSETGFDEISLEHRAKVYGDNDQGWQEVLVWLQRHVEKAS